MHIDYDYDSVNQGINIIGRKTISGIRIEIIEYWCEQYKEYEVRINNKRVFGDCDNKNQAIIVGKWWLSGCPA